MLANPEAAWKKLTGLQITNLGQEFYMQEFRKIHSGEIISMGGIKYVVAHNFEFSLEGRQIDIRTYLDEK